MNRRNLLKAAAAAPLATFPLAAQAETPLAVLYDRWIAAREAYNENDFDDVRDAELYSAMRAIEGEILAYPPKSVRDYAYKIVVMDSFFEIDGPIGEPFMAEARALIA